MSAMSAAAAIRKLTIQRFRGIEKFRRLRLFLRKKGMTDIPEIVYLRGFSRARAGMQRQAMGAAIPTGIDARATFHREDLIGEHIGCHL